MPNYYDKNRKLDRTVVPESPDDGDKDKRARTAPADPTVQDPGQPYIPPITAPDGGPPVQTLGGMDQTGLPPRAGLQKDGLIVENDTPGNDLPQNGGITGNMPRPDPTTDLSTVNKVSDALANGSIMNSPLMQQIAANQAKLIALKMQPTYVDKNGKTVVGMQDKNGRMKSGLRAMLDNLAQPGQTRTWEDLLAKVSGGISAGVTGAIVPNWDEKADRVKEINQLEADTNDMMRMATWQSQMATQDVGRQDKLADNQRQEEVLRQKKRTDFYRNNRAFDPTKASEAQVRQLAEIGETPMSMGHYDFTKADVKWVNGQAWQKDPVTGAFVNAGLPEQSNKALVEYKVKDPDTDVESTYLVPQEKAAQLKTNLQAAGMQITAASERQASQQTFQREENAKSREVQMAQLRQTIQAYKATTAKNYLEQRQKLLESSDLSKPEKAEMIALLDANNPEFVVKQK